MLNDVLQIAAVVIVLIICAIWTIKKIRNMFFRKDKENCTDCCGCELSKRCNKKSKA